MARADLRFAPGTLFQAVKDSTERARRKGAVHSIHTDQRFIEHDGVRFLVRSVSALAEKDRARISEAENARNDTGRENPFLPYDPDVFVANISQTHVGLLNKFNVMSHHLLIVTREFEHQETPLTPADFEALWACLSEIDGIGFYNGGAAAGASQPHKHLQVVPLPLANEGPAIPMEPLLTAGRATGSIDMLTGLPFAHAFGRHEPGFAERSAAAEYLRRRYLAMLDRLALTTACADGETRRAEAYNLLVTRKWMLLVPRAREHFEKISINALGFAGSLFVRNDDEMETIKRHGPMNALRGVALPYDR